MKGWQKETLKEPQQPSDQRIGPQSTSPRSRTLDYTRPPDQQIGPQSTSPRSRTLDYTRPPDQQMGYQGNSPRSRTLDAFPSQFNQQMNHQDTAFRPQQQDYSRPWVYPMGHQTWDAFPSLPDQQMGHSGTYVHSPEMNFSPSPFELQTGQTDDQFQTPFESHQPVSDTYAYSQYPTNNLFPSQFDQHTGNQYSTHSLDVFERAAALKRKGDELRELAIRLRSVGQDTGGSSMVDPYPIEDQAMTPRAPSSGSDYRFIEEDGRATHRATSSAATGEQVKKSRSKRRQTRSTAVKESTMQLVLRGREQTNPSQIKTIEQLKTENAGMRALEDEIIAHQYEVTQSNKPPFDTEAKRTSHINELQKAVQILHDNRQKWVDEIQRRGGTVGESRVDPYPMDQAMTPRASSYSSDHHFIQEDEGMSTPRPASNAATGMQVEKPRPKRRKTTEKDPENRR